MFKNIDYNIAIMHRFEPQNVEQETLDLDVYNIEDRSLKNFFLMNKRITKTLRM